MAGERPFSGLTVLDLGQVYLGPYCTMLMSRLGADIIKVEPPGGEPVRWRGAQVGVETSAFGLLNTGKRSLRLDLKSERGRELLLQMADDADVLVENFGPGTLSRLGLGYEVLSERNPRLILASGRGYGPDGPYRDYLAMDLTVQAMSGVLATTGFADGPPLKAGPAVADFLGGIHLFGAIAAALVGRATTGRGRHVEIAMHDAVVPALASGFAGWLDSGGTLPSRTGNRHGAHAVAPYNVYPAADGWIAIIAMNDRHWERLCVVMGREELAADPELLHHRQRVAAIDRVDEIVSTWTRTLRKREAFDVLHAAGIPPRRSSSWRSSSPIRKSAPRGCWSPWRRKRRSPVDVRQPAAAVRRGAGCDHPRTAAGRALRADPPGEAGSRRRGDRATRPTVSSSVTPVTASGDIVGPIEVQTASDVLADRLRAQTSPGSCRPARTCRSSASSSSAPG